MLLTNYKALNGLPPAAATDAPAGGGAVTPAGAAAAQAGAQLIADNAVKEILPDGGLKILDAQEAVAKGMTKEAQAVLTKALTDDVKAGIRAMTIVKYVIGFAQMMVADRNKRDKMLRELTSRLRAWSVITKANFLAMCERDNEKINTVMGDLLNTAKVLGVPDDGTQGFSKDVKALKQAEAEMFQSQLVKEGGGKITLYEYHVGNIPNTTSIGWYGPVAIRPRVAKLIENKSKDVEELKKLFSKPVLGDAIPIDKLPVFPIPDIMFGHATVIGEGAWNPTFSSFVVGLADTVPYEKYSKDGVSASSLAYRDVSQALGNISSSGINLDVGTANLNFWLEVSEFSKKFGVFGLVPTEKTYIPPDNDKQAKENYKDFVREQADRIYPYREDPKSKDFKMFAKWKGKTVGEYVAAVGDPSYVGGESAIGQAATFGDMVDVGLKLDPEWGGSWTDSDVTIDQVLAIAPPLVRKYQDTYRNKVALKTEEGGTKLKPIGTYAKVLVNEGAVKSATTDMAIVPVVPVTWAKVDNAPVLYPHLVDAAAWKKYMLDPDVEVFQSLSDSHDFWDKELWDDKGPALTKILDDMVGCLGSQDNALCAWKPDVNGNLPSQLPYPLVYKYDKIKSLLPQYLTLAANKYSEISSNPISSEQQDLIDIRSEYKATVLLAMRAAEFAGTAMDSVDALIAAIKNLTAILYGDCPIEEAPDSMAKEELYDFYLKQTEACAASPKEGSLLDTLNKANELYKALLAKEASGDATASQTLQVVAQQIAKTQERVNVLVAELKGKLEAAKAGISDEGGVFYYIEYATKILAVLPTLPMSVIIGGVNVPLEPTQEEKDAIEETKKKLEILKIKGFKAVGFIGAQAQTLINVGAVFNINFGTSVGKGLTEIKEWAVNTLGTKKPFPWWLLLLAAAAAAKEKK